LPGIFVGNKQIKGVKVEVAFDVNDIIKKYKHSVTLRQKKVK